MNGMDVIIDLCTSTSFLVKLACLSSTWSLLVLSKIHCYFSWWLHSTWTPICKIPLWTRWIWLQLFYSLCSCLSKALRMTSNSCFKPRNTHYLNSWTMIRNGFQAITKRDSYAAVVYGNTVDIPTFSLRSLSGGASTCFLLQPIFNKWTMIVLWTRMYGSTGLFLVLWSWLCSSKEAHGWPRYVHSKDHGSKRSNADTCYIIL